MNRSVALAVLFACSTVGWTQKTPTALPANPTDTKFTAIYTAEAAWQRAQRGDESPEDERRGRVQPHLPKVDPATQQAKLVFWTGILKQLDELDPHQLSPAQLLNYKVYRAQIVVEMNEQKFREYEKPANSDSAFWSDEAGPATDPFKTEENYRNYIARLNDTPRYFREQIANMRAGLARGFTPPQVTLKGRDVSLRRIAEAKTPEASDYYKPFEKMPDSIPTETQAKLRADAAAAIRDTSALVGYNTTSGRRPTLPAAGDPRPRAP